MKVLIAEDNVLYRAVLCRNVVSWGHEPVVAEDGLQAWGDPAMRRRAAARDP